MKAIFFKLIADLLYRLGLAGAIDASLPRVLPNRARPGRPPENATYQVLNYHRVNDEAETFSLGAISSSHFERQMRYLKSNYRVLPLPELMQRAEAGELPPRSLGITFDDGYADNHRHAFPILKRLGIPATLFAVSECLEHRNPLWYDKVFFAFRQTVNTRVALPGVVDAPLDIASDPARRAVCEGILVALKRLPEKQRLDRMEALFAELGVSDFSPLHGLMMGWPEALEMEAGGFAIEAHSMTHPILSRLEPARLQEEISGCKRALEARLQRQVKLFAYPNGQSEDFNSQVSEVLRANGFTHAFTTLFGRNSRDTDVFQLKRAMPWYPDIPRFALCQAIIHATT